ncbi:trans-sulfuration enzyme family protein [Streptomyces sp. NBC_00582]|uniref:trans-sulfuration enzyme family protein n=1 Tax=Streptomyces sp. NBC_00582 TaxID=2975783 RepID=UPI0010634564|nr:aminotransferase class I/II-fold pyridoxal phosphate-dependent enzyme [Streptomyces sp. NBC_00582]WUB63938.1 aminotransferase class I/II-fold pyridoxal phosphate-dependent enzyme [Streptomyces sp. NBC_00582]
MTHARFTTLAVSGSYDHAEAARHLGSLSEPAHLATAQSFPSMEAMLAATAEDGDGWVYARRGNPTVRLLEQTVAALEGYRVDAEVSAALTATGMGAITLATMPLLSAAAGPKPNIVASPQCYGSTTMVFDKRYGEERDVDVRWVGDPLSVEDWAGLVDDGTRFLYAEVPSNPTVQLVDIPALAALARQARIPLIVDATLATPALLRPLALGADVVVHSLTKAAGASGRSMGGAVIARHGLGLRGQPEELSADYAGHLRRGSLRDMGAVLSPFNAWTILADIRELRGRVDTMSRTAHGVAEYLARHPGVVEVFYPGLESHRSHHIARRDMWLVDSELDGGEAENRFGFLVCFRPAGGVRAAHEVMDRLGLVWRANNLGQVRSTATIPGATTHKQAADADPARAPVPPDMVRLSIGIEHLDDIVGDLDQALRGR